ncbi:hypothetical protein [Pseudomonas vranovensis]|uniref:Uncharacterized protein n=1 Tax=Pseudomonas vranovensis TaxID=321661 RepID=A0A423DS12_9PSED|nr:hypothetical protein [Pseudomonas vranovensis]ROL74543.1 hypothetical protein BHU25_10025 [Pseudomonas vranovensis]
MTFLPEALSPDPREQGIHPADTQAAQNYAEIRQECRDKLNAFNTSQAYVFLRNRGYGTEVYTYNFFQRWLDGLLARRINYLANRENELLLLAMQARNEELHAKARQMGSAS